MNWTSSIFSWGSKRQQEIEWGTSGTQEEMDYVMVNGKKVKSAPGLRFLDEKGLTVAKRCGWIIGWGKLEDLNASNVAMDWVTKNGAEPKLQHFANNLLQLEEARLGDKKVILTAEQRKQFAQEMCDELIKPTGVDPAELTAEGYFILRKTEERFVKESKVIQAQKTKFATCGALPPIVVTALAMKELSKNNDLLVLEGSHERSSIVFNPSFKNSTANESNIKSDITIEYESLLGDLSNIALDKDVALGAMTTLMDQTAISEADPADFDALEKSISGVEEKFAENFQRIQVHNAKLNEMRTNMEEVYLSKQIHLDQLNQTVAERNKEIAMNSAELQRLEREMALLTDTKNQQISELEQQLGDANEEVAKLKQENRDKVPAAQLHTAEDEVADLQEKLDAQARRTKSLHNRVESIKLDAKARMDVFKTENRSIAIKKEHLEKTLREEKQSAQGLKRELEELKGERDTRPRKTPSS